VHLNSNVIGLYYPGDSLLHRVDPRSKIVASLVFVLALFAINSFGGLALMAAGLMTGISIARIPPAWLYRGLKPVLLLVAVTFLFQVLLRGGGEPIQLGPVTLYGEGLREGAFLASRLLLLVLSSTVLTFTTPPVMLTDGLSRLMAPLSRLRFPSYELALMMTIALRFIPTLIQEFDRIIKAQTARGADIRRGGPVRRARNLVPVLLPLFVMSFRHADDLALAMESRCYRGGRGRTSRRRLRFGLVDAAFALFMILLLAGGIWLGRFR
jgi:energy-coupling factor transport system permease protein